MDYLSRYVVNILRPHKTLNIVCLPKHVIFHILTFLDDKNYVNTLRSCKTLNIAYLDDQTLAHHYSRIICSPKGLYHVVKTGNMQALKLLSSHGHSIDTYEQFKELIHISIKLAHWDIYKWLVTNSNGHIIIMNEELTLQIINTQRRDIMDCATMWPCDVTWNKRTREAANKCGMGRYVGHGIIGEYDNFDIYLTRSMKKYL